jgi:hypothetical protein
MEELIVKRIRMNNINARCDRLYSKAAKSKVLRVLKENRRQRIEIKQKRRVIEGRIGARMQSESFMLWRIALL